MEKKKLIAILIALFVALICTLIIINRANVKYTAVSKTITVYQATSLIPARTTIPPGSVKALKVPASLKGLATSNVVGKSLLTTVMPGNYIFENEISQSSVALPQGMVSVTVPVNQSSSGNVISGDKVDVYSCGGNQPSNLLVKGVDVLNSTDSGNNYISGPSDGGILNKTMSANRVPAAVELMVPESAVQSIISNAKQPGIYLVRVK